MPDGEVLRREFWLRTHGGMTEGRRPDEQAKQWRSVSGEFIPGQLVRASVYFIQRYLYVAVFVCSLIATTRSMPKADHLQGSLEILVLKVLRRGPNNGYAIATSIEQCSDEVLRVEEGSLYPRFIE